jgi:hypothetical protein
MMRKSLLVEIDELFSRVTVANTIILKKNDHLSLFKKTPKTVLMPIKLLQQRPSPLDAEKRSLQYALATLKGKHPKREPILVWKVNRPDGSHFYSVRDGNTTLQMLKTQGWDKVPVHIENEISESELTPVRDHIKEH